MSGLFDRSISLIGEERFVLLSSACVLVVGLGGVGGSVLETLVRSGIGRLVLVDGDNFEPTNANRQILCTLETIGRNKAEVARDRVLSINPDAKVTVIPEFLNGDNVDNIVLHNGVTYCVDAIDDIKNKVLLIKTCVENNIPIVSAMGAGNRLDCGFAVTDVYKTKDDPFARKLRHELRAAGVKGLDVVCAVTPPTVSSGTPLSVAAPPMVMGAMLANHAIKNIIGL